MTHVPIAAVTHSTTRGPAMNLRFVAIITGCMLVGAGAAAYHRVDGRPAAPAR